MSEIKKMASLRLGPAALRELFQLPEGVEVVRIESDFGYRGGLRLVIEGAGWATAEGAPIQPAEPAIVTVTRDEAGQIARSTIDWRLPPVHCLHKNTEAIDPEHNHGETLRCTDCGMRKGARGGFWSEP